MYRVEINSNGDSAFKVKSKDYEFDVDTKGKGITPPDTLLASLGTCIGVYMRKYAEGAKLKIDSFKINVDAEFTKDSPLRFSQINLKIDLNGAEIEPRRKEAMLNFIKNCPIHTTLKNNPAVTTEIV